MTDCILQNCTVRQGLRTFDAEPGRRLPPPPCSPFRLRLLTSSLLRARAVAKNVTETMCGTPIRDKSQVGVLTVTILGTISATLSGIRIIFKIWSGFGVSGDDWWIAAGLFVGIPSTVLEIYGVSANGLGHDIWTVPFDDITRFDMYFYILELLYFVQVTLLKMSLLYFFLRIFPSLPVRRVLWGTVIFNSLYCLAFTLAAAFQCVPIDLFCTRWDNEHQGICLDSNAIVWSNAAISIAMDIWMLAIPLSQLYGLNQKWKKKVGVGLMFCVGALYVPPSTPGLVVAAFPRPIYENRTTDLTSDTVPVLQS